MPPQGVAFCFVRRLLRAIGPISNRHNRSCRAALGSHAAREDRRRSAAAGLHLPSRIPSFIHASGLVRKPPQERQRGLQQRIGRFLRNVVAARQRPATHVVRHTLPFGQRIETLVHHALLAP